MLRRYCIEIETSKIYKTIQTPQEHNPDFSTLNNHENLVQGDLLFVASLAGSCCSHNCLESTASWSWERK